MYPLEIIRYVAYVFQLQLDRHMRRLHQDLNKFTIELEADTAGITEILEQSMPYTYVQLINRRGMGMRNSCPNIKILYTNYFQ